MIWISVFVVVVAQLGAMGMASRAYHEAGLWTPNKAKRNRLAFSCLVLSAVALLTAYRIGVSMGGC